MQHKVFLINLDSSHARLEFMQSECDKLGINFERIAAVRGSDLSQEDKAKVYNIEENKKSYDSLLTDGELGCYLSHIQCWQKIVDEKLDYALILEDDAKLDAELLTYQNYLEQHLEHWDYIELSYGSKIRPYTQSVAIDSALKLVVRPRINSTTAAQFVSYAGAKKLLKHALPIKRPVDIDLQYWYDKSIRCYSVDPLPVKNGNFESDISAMGRKNRSSSLFLRVLQQNKHKLMLKLKARDLNLDAFPFR